MRLFFWIVVGAFSVSGCAGNDDDNTIVCGVEKPTQELSWLKEEIEQREQSNSEDIKYCYITQGV